MGPQFDFLGPEGKAPPPRDFYFSISEARGDQFTRSDGSICEYVDEAGELIWATEVTAPGAQPGSRNRDLLLVRRNTRARFVRRRNPHPGDIWAPLQKEPYAHSA